MTVETDRSCFFNIVLSFQLRETVMALRVIPMPNVSSLWMTVHPSVNVTKVGKAMDKSVQVIRTLSRLHCRANQLHALNGGTGDPFWSISEAILDN